MRNTVKVLGRWGSRARIVTESVGGRRVLRVQWRNEMGRKVCTWPDTPQGQVPILYPSRGCTGYCRLGRSTRVQPMWLLSYFARS